jgi:hypothetical protein
MKNGMDGNMDARIPKMRKARNRQSSGTAAARRLLRRLREVGHSPQAWFEPSPASAARWKAIPLIGGVTQRTRPRSGRVVFDSWDMTPAVALRDIVDGHIRRLELKAGRVSLEIVAERTQDHWEFVGRIYANNEIQNSYVLKVGRFNLLPRTNGFYHWSSTSVPRTLRVVSYRNNLVFGGIQW